VRARRPRGPRGWRRPDDRILDELCERIARSGVDARDVEVRAQDGEVFLQGTVENVAELATLLDLPDLVVGVRAIHADLHLERRLRRAAGDEIVEPDPETRH
jgi:osmotically-inducible protein OsmY